MKRRDRQHVRTPRVDIDEDEESSEDSDYKQLTRDDNWNADVTKCVEGAFAVVHSLYVSQYGLSIIKVCVLFVLINTNL